MKIKSAHAASRGYLLMETLVAVVLFSLVMISVIPTVNFMLKRSRRAVSDSDAALLLQEGMEATYTIFLSDWDAYGDGTYHLESVTSPSTHWELLPGNEILEAKFTRTIEINEVRRSNVTGEQLETGVIDPNSKIIKTTINWDEAGIPYNISAELLVINFTR
ncbi:hypothetical protein C4579_04805 [Candidatus Microgenomates bacterium]|nr:MAG: hypothetical protein C4579_04805 [Candidatus Microgenomates bacterium]